MKANVVSNLTQSSSSVPVPTGRLPYIDAIRGAAFLGMMVHHFIFFMFWHGVVFISPWSSFVQILGWIVRITFVLLVGVSSYMWFLKYWTGNSEKLFEMTIKRAAKVGLAAILVTVFTTIVVPDIPIYFGVLHMITYSVVFVVPFLSIPRLAWLVGVFLVLLSRLHAAVSYDLGIYWLVAPDVRPPALDYFPMLPWFGVVLIGVSCGYYAYEQRAFFPSQAKALHMSILSWFGRHALVLYVVHFPLIWAITYALSMVLL